MPVTYSSDHDWEMHTTFDIENLFGTNSENDNVNNCCTISAIYVPSNYDMLKNEHTLEDSYSIAYDDYKDEYDIFDDYGDDNNIDSYIVEFAPTTINKNDYVHVRIINSFMHVAPDKNVLCDSYIVNSIHGFMHLNNIKFPLFMLKFLTLVLHSYACCFVLS
jgi:hypothetical protein